MSRSGVILLVEDSPDDVELTRLAFAKNKLVNGIVVARDGQEAIDYLFGDGTHADRGTKRMPEIVLLDLMLPKVDGFGVLRRIRADQRTRHLPVVILTSSDEERDIVASYDLGANSFVRKPVDFVEFEEAASQLGRYWLKTNEALPRP